MIGQTISHYRITEKLGGGGMGVVYKAHDTRLKRTVALKFLPPDLTRDEEAKTRFVHEAQAASALQHNNICNIHDIDETRDGQTFIVMDCYDGETLKKKIEQGPLKIDGAVDIAVQIGQGLQKAHEHGIVHRDIKPANVMLTTDGVAKIVDFGLAKLSGRTVLTKTGSTVGTAAYMSPEQARSEAVDARSDIWSLGVVLYEMLTGKKPFESEYEQALVYSILSHDPKPMRELHPEVPEALEKICRRAMAKDLKDRYQTAAELIADLESCKAGTQLARQTRKGLSKQRKVTYAGLAATVLTVGILGIFYFTGRGEVLDHVAVLPFRNFSGEEKQEWLADAMTEEVISRLQDFAALRLPSFRSVMKFKKSQESYGALAKIMHAKALVEASVFIEESGRIRVRAKLIDPATDRPLWSDTLNGTRENILDLQSRIAQAVVREVRVKVSQDERTRMSRSSRKVDPLAYELCLKARQDIYSLSSEISKSRWDSLMANLQKAIDIEPDNAFYYASLAMGYQSAINWGLVSSVDAMPKMKSAAETALQLDPDLAESQIAASHVDKYQYNFEGALSRTARALELSPGSFEAYRVHGGTLKAVGRYEESIVMFRRSQEIDPILFKQVAWGIGQTYWLMRRYDDAIAYLQQYLRENPKSDPGHTMLAASFSMKGMHAQALAQCDSMPYWGPPNRPIFLAKAGKRALAMQAYSKVRSTMSPVSKAEFFATLGDKESAIEWLQRAYREPSGELMLIRGDAFLDNVRDDPRFKELLRKMNLLD
jgi:serine/threonine protein kinase/Tfp pilus assembly protein PilF